jgi:hypothetical protein
LVMPCGALPCTFAACVCPSQCSGCITASVPTRRRLPSQRMVSWMWQCHQRPGRQGEADGDFHERTR